MSLLQPGIYVGARKVTLGHFMPIPGWHEFMVLVPRDPNRFAEQVTDIGGGNRGIVVGAYRTGPMFNRQLRYQRNADKEISAIREYFARQEDPQSPEFFRTKMERAGHQGRDTDATIDMFLSLAQTYRRVSKKEPMSYPGVVTNLLGEGPNSNTFIQSMLDVGGIKKKPELGVFMPGSDLRFPSKWFGKTSAFLDGYMEKMAYSATPAQRKAIATRRTSPWDPGKQEGPWERDSDKRWGALMNQAGGADRGAAMRAFSQRQQTQRQPQQPGRAQHPQLTQAGVGNRVGYQRMQSRYGTMDMPMAGVRPKLSRRPVSASAMAEVGRTPQQIAQMSRTGFPSIKQQASQSMPTRNTAVVGRALKAKGHIPATEQGAGVGDMGMGMGLGMMPPPPPDTSAIPGVSGMSGKPLGAFPGRQPEGFEEAPLGTPNMTSEPAVEPLPTDLNQRQHAMANR